MLPIPVFVVSKLTPIVSLMQTLYSVVIYMVPIHNILYSWTTTLWLLVLCYDTTCCGSLTTNEKELRRKECILFLYRKKIQAKNLSLSWTLLLWSLKLSLWCFYYTLYNSLVATRYAPTTLWLLTTQCTSWTLTWSLLHHAHAPTLLTSLWCVLLTSTTLHKFAILTVLLFINT